ncbi:hypothetical protein, partial [Herbiconiux daphne]
ILNMISTANVVARTFDASPKGADTVTAEGLNRWDDTRNAVRTGAGDVLVIVPTMKAINREEAVIAFGVIEGKETIDFADTRGEEWVASKRRYGTRYTFGDVALISYSDLSDELKAIVNLPGQSIGYKK